MSNSSRKGDRCIVHYCRRKATTTCPLGEDALELPVCGVCAEEIAANPAGWMVTSYPGRIRDDKDLTVIIRTGTELGVAP